jgi:hypothetical protein
MYAPGEETIQILRVQPDGTFIFPYLGARKVIGLNEAQLEQDLIKAYRDANLVQNLSCSVLILEPAPPDAATRDLPDEPLNPVPPALQWLYDDRTCEGSGAVTSKKVAESRPRSDARKSSSGTARKRAAAKRF